MGKERRRFGVRNIHISIPDLSQINFALMPTLDSKTGRESIGFNECGL